MTDEASRKDVWIARAKAWGALLATLGGLVTAVTALLKPRDDSATHAAYTALAAGQERLSNDVQGLHDDVAALRGYLAAQEGQPLPSSGGSHPTLPSIDAPDAGPKLTLRLPKPAATPTALAASAARPKAAIAAITLGAIDVGEGLGAGSGGGLASIAFGPPPVHPTPVPVKPIPFDQVLKSADVK